MVRYHCATEARPPGSTVPPSAIIGGRVRNLKAPFRVGAGRGTDERSRIRTCVASATILQTVPFSHSGIRPRCGRITLEPTRGLEPQPMVYKTIALPLSYVGPPARIRSSDRRIIGKAAPNVKRPGAPDPPPSNKSGLDGRPIGVYSLWPQ